MDDYRYAAPFVAGVHGYPAQQLGSGQRVNTHVPIPGQTNSAVAASQADYQAGYQDGYHGQGHVGNSQAYNLGYSNGQKAASSKAGGGMHSVQKVNMAALLASWNTPQQQAQVQMGYAAGLLNGTQSVQQGLDYNMALAGYAASLASHSGAYQAGWHAAFDKAYGVTQGVSLGGKTY